MKLHVARLTRNQDLKQKITELAGERNIRAGVVLSAVGSLHEVVLRMAGAKADKEDVREYHGGAFEIVSLIGTIATKGELHLHMAVSDEEGRVIGGHLKNGNLVDTTVELVILEDTDQQFVRLLDVSTGFKELA